MFQQPLLSPKAAGITDEGSVGSNNAVTWNYDGQIVSAIGICNCTRCFRVTSANGKIKIANGSSEGNCCEFIPDSFLKACPSKINRNLKGSSITLEVLNKFFYALNDQWWKVVTNGYFIIGVICEGDFIDKFFRACDL